MYECTVTVDGEDESSFFGITGLANAMEQAVFNLAYLPWCKDRLTVHRSEHELSRGVPEISLDEQPTRSITMSARVQQVISEVRANVAARREQWDEGWGEAI